MRPSQQSKARDSLRHLHLIPPARRSIGTTHAKCHTYTMKSTIDNAGRVVIPKALRLRLGLRGGEELEIRERDGRIEIEPAATTMSLVERSGSLVAVPAGELPPLTDEIVRDTIERMRR